MRLALADAGDGVSTVSANADGNAPGGRHTSGVDATAGGAADVTAPGAAGGVQASGEHECSCRGCGVGVHCWHTCGRAAPVLLIH